MNNISNHDDNEDQNIIATTLADNINTSHMNTLPQNDSDMMDVSQDRNSGNNLNLGPQSNETARALQARKNLAGPKKCHPLPHICHTPSPSSDSHSDGPDLKKINAILPTRNEKVQGIPIASFMKEVVMMLALLEVLTFQQNIITCLLLLRGKNLDQWRIQLMWIVLLHYLSQQ